MNTGQEAQLRDRRRFPRYDVDEGSLFSWKKQITGFARIINLSRCGAKCVSLSTIQSFKGLVENVELYIPDLNLDLKNLSGQVIECKQISQPTDGSFQTLCEFRFEFFLNYSDSIPDLLAVRRMLNKLSAQQQSLIQ